MTQPSAIVVIPTTGSNDLKQAVQSVKNQTYQNTHCLVVVDGPEFDAAARAHLSGVDNITIMTLPWNTGAGGYNGQRIYASVGNLVPHDYILYLDQDNYFEPTHVESCMGVVARGVSWCHSLRNIVSKAGDSLGQDNCESLGRWPTYQGPYHLVDTSCYCVSKEIASKCGPAWLKLWGEDRQFFSVISKEYRSFACTGKYTVNYRLGGNPNSVTWDFFKQGNAEQLDKYHNGFPWVK